MPPSQTNGGLGPKPPVLGKDPDTLWAENEQLFAEFVDFCAQHTVDHPEVMPYLSGRHQKTNFLSSVELRNVKGCCLTQVQARRSKIYIYINELCTVFKAHDQQRKLAIARATPVVQGGSAGATGGAGENAGAAAAPTDKATPTPSDAPEAAKAQLDSWHHIQYLKNLLQVYAEEVRQLQERELDLAEMDREDSAYLQESQLKWGIMLILQCLWAGHQVAYQGTTYLEVNCWIERLINRHPEAFPDYTNILKVLQKASRHHSLGLPKRQMESMAANTFQEVGNRLQERRHLDLIYNFGSHLTDQYRTSVTRP